MGWKDTPLLWVYFAWIILLMIGISGSLAGLILGSIYTSNYVSERWLNATCYVAEAGTVRYSCKGTCWEPQWIVSFVDIKGNNVTTFCKDPDYSNKVSSGRNQTLALEWALKYPVDTVLPVCMYDPASVDKCRTIGPNPEAPLRVAIGLWVGLVAFPVCGWTVTLFAITRCCTKRSCSLF